MYFEGWSLYDRCIVLKCEYSNGIKRTRHVLLMHVNHQELCIQKHAHIWKHGYGCLRTCLSRLAFFCTQNGKRHSDWNAKKIITVDGGFKCEQC